MASDSITDLLDYNLSSEEGKLVSGILNIALMFIQETKAEVHDFSSMADFLIEPPSNFEERVASIAGKKELASLARRLRLLTVGAKKLLFELGKPLSIESLLGKSEKKGKTRLSVIYLNTLSTQQEKDFLVAQVATSLYQWMIANPSEEIQALFYIDEIAPFLPPIRKPACKDILKLLFKQARKYGVGCIFASQNPGDIDYTAISQCSTWALGRLLTRQDIKKIEKLLKSLSPEQCDYIIPKLPSLKPGHFLLFSPDEFEAVQQLQLRWLLTQHKTLDEEQIKILTPESLREKYTVKSSLSSSHLPEKKVLESPPNHDDKKLPMDKRILLLLQSEPQCMSCAEISDRLETSPATIRKYISSLGSKITKEKLGKTILYWYEDYKFLPEHGLKRFVDVAKLQILEPEAIRLAEKRLNRKYVFFETEEIEKVHLFYLPLWQVYFTEELNRSFLLFKFTKQKQENIYFHAMTGQICVYKPAKGFSFLDTPKENPSILLDLDDVCTFESVMPGDLEIDWDHFDERISEKKLEKLIARKFKIDVHRIAMTFLPVWKITIRDKNSEQRRVLQVDGVIGLPIEI